MKLTRKSDPERTVLSISGDLDIYHSHELRENLLAALDESSRLEISFGNVSTVDLSFLQILYSAYKTARIRERELIVSGDFLPDPVALLCRQIGCHRDRFFARYFSSRS